MNNIVSNLHELTEQTKINLSKSKSNNTLRAYKSDFEDFKLFCLKFKLPFLPTNNETISLYLTHLSKYSKFSTIKRRLASISSIHKLKNHYVDINHPVIKANLNGIKRHLGTKQKSKKPILFNTLKLLINSINEENSNKLVTLRDISILLLGFSGGFRRSEIINLNIEDLEFVSEGVKIILNKSKTDQYGEGHIKGIPYFSNKIYCPVENTKKYIEAGKINTGPLYRSINKADFIGNKRLTDQSVALIIKKHLNRLNIENFEFSGHSLRSGFATSAADSGADERSIMQMTGHKTTEMVRRYIKESNIFKNNALNNIKVL